MTCSSRSTPPGGPRSARTPSRCSSAVEPDELERLAADPGFVEKVDAAKEALDRYLGEDRWYQQWGREEAEGVPSRDRLLRAEFGITAALPQYSGGLGILAGDHLKAASDLGVPIVGVGLFYGPATSARA